MSRKEVIRRIVERETQGQRLSERAVLREASDLHRMACELFGAWGTALVYAGVKRQYRLVPACDTPECVLQQIRRLCQEGYCLRARTQSRHRTALYRAACEHFGSWRQAMIAAGINLERANLYGKPRALHKPKILAALQARHRAGQSLAWSRICLEDRGLATAAKYAFGGWKRALVAAGLAEEAKKPAS